MITLKNLKLSLVVKVLVFVAFIGVLAGANLYKGAFKQRYLDYLETYLQTQKMLLQASENKTLILDERWKNELGQSLVVLNLKSDELAGFNPRYFYFHTTTVKLADATHRYSDALTASIKNAGEKNAEFDPSVLGMHGDNIGAMTKEIVL